LPNRQRRRHKPRPNSDCRPSIGLSGRRERAEWEALSQSVEEDRTRVQEQLAALQAQAEATPPQAIQAIVEQGIQAGQELALDDAKPAV
jgi:hypothetical protein